MSCKKQAVPHVMQKTSCSTCHAKKQAVPHVMQKNKLFHMSCKNHAKTMQNAARTERQPAEPSLSPVPCYMCYMCYMALWHIYYRFSRVQKKKAHIVHEQGAGGEWMFSGLAKNMFIRHVIRHVEAIKRVRSPGRVEVPRLGAAGM